MSEKAIRFDGTITMGHLLNVMSVVGGLVAFMVYQAGHETSQDKDIAGVIKAADANTTAITQQVTADAARDIKVGKIETTLEQLGLRLGQTNKLLENISGDLRDIKRQ